MRQRRPFWLFDTPVRGGGPESSLTQDPSPSQEPLLEQTLGHWPQEPLWVILRPSALG